MCPERAAREKAVLAVVEAAGLLDLLLLRLRQSSLSLPRHSLAKQGHHLVDLSVRPCAESIQSVLCDFTVVAAELKARILANILQKAQRTFVMGKKQPIATTPLRLPQYVCKTFFSTLWWTRHGFKLDAPRQLKTQRKPSPSAKMCFKTA